MPADVTINVTANTADAEQKLRKVGDQLKGAAQGGGPVTAAANPAAGGAAGPAAAAGWGSVGKQIGVAAVGFMANQGIQTVSTVVGNREGGGRMGRAIGNIGGGLVAGAALGGTVGSVVGGPIGTAIGGAIGAIAGAATGIAKELSEGAKAVREARQNLAAEFRALEVGQAAGEQDRAFSRILATKGRDEQLAMVGQRIDQIRNGPGEMSLRYLRERRGELEDEEQTDTEEYRIIRERMGIQMGRLSALMRTREELSLAPTAGLSDASRVTDSLGAVGGSVGPTVNVADVNRRQLDVLQQILQTLRTAASEDVSSGATLDSRAAAVYG